MHTRPIQQLLVETSLQGLGKMVYDDSPIKMKPSIQCGKIQMILRYG